LEGTELGEPCKGENPWIDEVDKFPVEVPKGPALGKF